MAVDLYFLFASSVAAVVARLVTHPIDTIKIRIQASTHKTSIKKALLDHSFISLFDGLSVTLIMCVPALSAYLSTYESTKSLLSTQLDWATTSIWTHLVSGCMAEVFAGIFYTPMEVVKGRMQNRQQQQEEEESTMYDSNTRLLPPPMDNDTTSTLIKSIYTKEGWKGFYKGYWITLFVFVPQTVIYFVLYERLKLKMEPGLPAYLIGSIVASTISTAVCNPLDVIKTRQQVALDGDYYNNSTSISTIAYHMYRTEGWRSFTKGTLTRIIWGAPMTTISMCVFEVLKDWHAM